MPPSTDPQSIDPFEPPAPSRTMGLPTPVLQQAWVQALLDIARARQPLGLLHQVAVAQGFVWALELAELLSYEQTTALNAAVHRAERAALPRLAGGGQ